MVAVRDSGVYDLVKDGSNGFAVAESTDAWAAKIAQVMEDNGLLSGMSANSREFANKYSVEKITERVLKLYCRVLVIAQSKSV